MGLSLCLLQNRPHQKPCVRATLVQVDEQSVFRHRGERKVKTVEEDMEAVTSSAAELLEDGEELIGKGRNQGPRRGPQNSLVLSIAIGGP